MALPFNSSSRQGDAWFFVGNSSSFPNTTESGNVILADEVTPLDCQSDLVTVSSRYGCKVFLAPERINPSSRAEQLSHDPKDQLNATLRKGDQVLVFQYKDKFHAVDNKCPHSAYPLSNGTPFDIEDFGIALSAGISCSKHGWSFDLFSGRSDRGSYRLNLWEVELRDVAGDRSADRLEKEVWVRRKQKIG